MVKLYRALAPLRLRVLLVHVPVSRLPYDLIAAKTSARWQQTKAERDSFVSDVENTDTLLNEGWHLTSEELTARQRRIVDVRGRVYNLIRFSGAGHVTPYLRNLVYSANLSYTPIEAALPNDSILYRYIQLFPVSKVELNY